MFIVSDVHHTCHATLCTVYDIMYTKNFFQETVYCIAGKFGGGKFWRISCLLVNIILGILPVRSGVQEVVENTPSNFTRYTVTYLQIIHSGTYLCNL